VLPLTLSGHFECNENPRMVRVVQMAIIALASTTPELVPQFPSTLRVPITPSTIGVM